MARYFLDTNVLLGYSFLQNFWQNHTERLLETDNALYIGETVLYEYCVKTQSGAPSEDLHIDWSHDAGKLGDERRRLRKAKRKCELDLRSYGDDLTPTDVSELVIDEFDVEDEVAPKVHRYFTSVLSESCTVSDAKEAINRLVNTIITTSKQRKTELARRLHYLKTSRSRSTIRLQLRRLIYGDDESYGPDASLLTEAYDLNERGILSRVVTGDKGDIYLNREEIEAITGLTTLYLQDQFATQSIGGTMDTAQTNGGEPVKAPAENTDETVE